MAIVSENPFICEPERIKDITVEMTIVGGKIVFSR